MYFFFYYNDERGLKYHLHIITFKQRTFEDLEISSQCLLLAFNFSYTAAYLKLYVTFCFISSITDC